MHNSFLNIEWKILGNNNNLVDNISLNISLSKVLIQVLVNRGFDTVNSINKFLNCKLKNTIPDPFLILDIEKAVLRITQAILHKEQVIIFGDYDVDGMTSTSLLLKALQFYELQPKFFLPNRLKGAYGITKNFLDSIKTDLLIITDSGIGAIKEVEYANQLGMDVVIFDHHPQLIDELPKAVAVVDPNRIDQKPVENAAIQHLCAAGVVFMFLIALNRNMLKYGYNALNIMDLVQISAIGTMGDLVPLTGINRALVKYLLNQKEYALSITSLINALELEHIKSSEDIAFSICPVLNAAGRLGEQNKTVELLMTNDYNEAINLSYELISLNEKRKSIEKQVLEEAIDIIQRKNLNSNNALCIYNNLWHEGVIGIIAGKIKDKFNKPTFVISFDENGFGKGSARSIKGLHIGEVINKAVQRNILVVGGGHAKAGGLSIYKENIDKFILFLEEVIPSNIKSSLNVDCVLPNDEDLFDLFNKLKLLEPFGTEFEFPSFGFIGIKLNNLYIKPDHYIKFNFGKYNTKCMLFNINLNSHFIEQLKHNINKLYDIVGQISYNEKFGLCFILKDIKLSKMV